jgi:hypothetical protein
MVGASIDHALQVSVQENKHVRSISQTQSSFPELVLDPKNSFVLFPDPEKDSLDAALQSNC